MALGDVALERVEGSSDLTMVPALRRLPPGQRWVVHDLGDDHVGVDEHDVATQATTSHRTTTRAGGRVERSTTPFRCARPSELDLTARLAGLRLRDRWAGWDRAPFEESASHVPVWTADGSARPAARPSWRAAPPRPVH